MSTTTISEAMAHRAYGFFSLPNQTTPCRPEISEISWPQRSRAAVRGQPFFLEMEKYTITKKAI